MNEKIWCSCCQCELSENVCEGCRSAVTKNWFSEIGFPENSQSFFFFKLKHSIPAFVNNGSCTLCARQSSMICKECYFNVTHKILSSVLKSKRFKVAPIMMIQRGITQ
jgi:hypothetical protein